ncbi:uncharacterized protein [Nicotiana sylvestris]|uniref:uncharacterized protein n=1 Tax=Nicotiana sylvestris TaxID=4096 RepID=UPI00388CC433
MELLKEFKDVFSWSYKVMPGLDPKVAVHHLVVKNGTHPVKQAQRRFRPDLVPLIETEVNKLIKVGFIHEVKYSTRVSKLMIDATTGYEAMSFMDECWCYLPTGYAKYLDDLLHKNVEYYVDDLVVPTLDESIKCAFGVTPGKFLSFIVRHRGIEIDQAKVDAILKTSEPRDIHELKSLQGKLAYLRRFTSNLPGRCQPFNHLMKKGVPFKWDQACSNTFESIRTYSMMPPVLAASIPEKLLILCISAQERSVGVMLAQKNSTGKENSLYYLNMMMKPNEMNYSPIKKLCLALVFSIQKLKHYFQAHVVHLVSRANPIKFVISKPVLSDRLARWYLQFQQFKIVYIPQKAIKGQALADFLANHHILDDWKLDDELPDEDKMVIEVQPPWKMYFDGAAHAEELVLLFGGYEVKKPELRPYYDYAKKLIGLGDDATIQYVPRKENKKADALSALASSLTLPDQAEVIVCQKLVVPPPNEVEGEENELKHLVAVSKDEKEEWRQPIIDYLSYEILPENPRRRTKIRFLHLTSFTTKIPYTEAIQEELTNEENARLRLAELEALGEKRLESQRSLECSQDRLSCAFNKRVRPRSFQVGDKILGIRRPIITSHKPIGKFTLKWDGPYVVQEAYSSGAYKLVDANGMRIDPINGMFLKKYHP